MKMDKLICIAGVQWRLEYDHGGIYSSDSETNTSFSPKHNDFTRTPSHQLKKYKKVKVEERVA